MRTGNLYLRLAGVAILAVTACFQLAASPQQSASASNAAAPVQPGALIDKYCVSCHSERLKTGGLILEKLDLAKVADHAETLEKVVLKLRGGMMPPPGLPRPDNATLDALATRLEKDLDQAYLAKSNPGQSACTA